MSASANTIFALDDAIFRSHQREVESSTEFLERLRAAGATQAKIGEVLGIAQANAATFYTAGRNGKLRTLKWDEGVKLAKAFGLEPPEQESAPEPAVAWASAETIAPILDALLPLVPTSGLSDRSVEVLSEALAHGLQLLGESGASPKSEDALRVAARGAASRFRDLLTQ